MRTKSTWIKCTEISAGKNVTPGLMLLLIQWKVNGFVCRCYSFKISFAQTWYIDTKILSLKKKE